MIGKLIKFVITVAIILALFVGACYLGSEVLDIDFCDDVVDFVEDLFDDAFSSSASESKGEYTGVFYEVFPDADGFEKINLDNYPEFSPYIKEAVRDTRITGCAMVFSFDETTDLGTPITFAVGVSYEGVITGVRILDWSGETDFAIDEYVRIYTNQSRENLENNYEEFVFNDVSEFIYEVVFESFAIAKQIG